MKLKIKTRINKKTGTETIRLPRTVTKRIRKKAIAQAKKEWQIQCHCIRCLIMYGYTEQDVYIKKRSEKLYKIMRLQYIEENRN